MTDYKRNALDPQRIAKLAAQNCGCNGACYTLFRPQQILSICRLWHALPLLVRAVGRVVQLLKRALMRSPTEPLGS